MTRPIEHVAYAIEELERLAKSLEGIKLPPATLPPGVGDLPLLVRLQLMQIASRLRLVQEKVE